MIDLIMKVYNSFHQVSSCIRSNNIANPIPIYICAKVEVASCRRVPLEIPSQRSHLLSVNQVHQFGHHHHYATFCHHIPLPLALPLSPHTFDFYYYTVKVAITCATAASVDTIIIIRIIPMRTMTRDDNNTEAAKAPQQQQQCNTPKTDRAKMKPEIPWTEAITRSSSF